MTKNLPNYPRLHVGDSQHDEHPSGEQPGGLANLLDAFQVATGWSVALEPRQQGRELALKSASGGAPAAGEAEPIDRHRADSLADAISNILSELDRAHDELRRREAELAAGVPVAPRQDEEEHLALRLESVLQGGAEAIDCQAAGLYLLDPATTELKLRACWGLPNGRLLEPPRPLGEAFADLEALAGHAVAIEDASLLPHWQPPESFPAALCVPVSSPTEPLGTLWLFDNRTRDFTGQQTNLAEIIAGRIASELQREVLLSECVTSQRKDRQLIHAVQWQHDHLPTIQPLLDDWEIAGWAAGDDRLCSGFYDWFVPPDGSLALAIGVCDGLMVESALSASALQAAVRSHASHRHRVAEMIIRVNETIWNSSAGGHFASLFYAQVVPETGELECAAAGKLNALLVRESETEVISSDQLLLGLEPEIRNKALTKQIRPGDVLMLVASDQPTDNLTELSGQLRKNRSASVDELSSIACACVPELETALILRRSRS